MTVSKPRPDAGRHPFKRVVLHLARSPGFPDGSSHHGYEMLLPLQPDGHLDPEVWRANEALCRVRRFWGGEPERIGWLMHKPGGRGGATWGIDYDEDDDLDDEAGYRFELHTFALGEYVTIRDRLGAHTFRVVAVEDQSTAAIQPRQ